MPFTYQTFAQVKTALALRLANPGKVFWTDTELGLYVIEALRTWQAFTAYWIDEYEFIYAGTSTGTDWLNASQLPGTPRPYTQLNTDLYSMILYHLLEPQIAPDGITWLGTSQFSFDDLTGALERRQNEILALTGSNLVRPVPIVLTPNTRHIVLPDNFLDVRRVKYVPPRTPTDFGPAQVLWRGDLASFGYFTAGFIQQRQNPRNYALSDVPPLELEVDFPPPNPGVMDMLVTLASSIPTPPGTQALVIPDDWVWVAKWGMLMDILNKQSESRDEPRAEYCKTRYLEGVQLLQTAPWVVAANIENVPVNIESVMERDQYDPGWEYNANTRQGIIAAGLDTFAVAPLPGLHPTSSVVLSLVQNAPVPALDADFVQVPRDTLDIILDYAEHLAMFKCGGSEFESTTTLFDNFRKAAMLANKRISNLGLYDDQMKREGRRQEEVDARYA
jgi:hypothetical protein